MEFLLTYHDHDYLANLTFCNLPKLYRASQQKRNTRFREFLTVLGVKVKRTVIFFEVVVCSAIYSQTGVIRIARDREKHSYNSDFRTT